MENETIYHQILRDRMDKLSKQAKDDLLEIVMSIAFRKELTEEQKKQKVIQIVRQYLK